MTYNVAVYRFERVERYVMGQLVLQEEAWTDPEDEELSG